MINYKMSNTTLNIKHSEQRLLWIKVAYRKLTFPVPGEVDYGVGWLTVKTKVIEMGQHEA